MSAFSAIKRTVTALAAATVVSVGLAAGASAATTHAGDTLLIETKDGMARCSLAYVAGSGDQLYGVSAGHCADPEVLGSKPTRILNYQGEVLWEPSAGPITYRNEASYVGVDQPVTDYSVFPLVKGTANSGMVTSTPVVGIVEVDELLQMFATAPALPVGNPIPVSDVRVGEIVCKDGSSTGRTCGPVVGVNNDTQDIYAIIPAISGDSGAALTVNRGGVLHPVGILSGGDPLLFNMFDSTTVALAATGH